MALPSTEPSESVEVVLFHLGKRPYVVARAAILAIRPSPRTLGRRAAEGSVRVLSLSELLDLQRDTAVDRRVLDVIRAGSTVAVEVTSIVGIRRLPEASLAALPALVRRNCGSSAVLGLADTDHGPAVALDLVVLLAERGPTDTPVT